MVLRVATDGYLLHIAGVGVRADVRDARVIDIMPESGIHIPKAISPFFVLRLAMVVLFSAFGNLSRLVVASKLIVADVVVLFFWANDTLTKVAKAKKRIVFFIVCFI